MHSFRLNQLSGWQRARIEREIGNRAHGHRIGVGFGDTACVAPSNLIPRTHRIDLAPGIPHPSTIISHAATSKHCRLTISMIWQMSYTGKQTLHVVLGDFAVSLST